MTKPSLFTSPTPRSPGQLLVAAYLLDRLAGDPAKLHPVAGFGRLAAFLEGRLWRPSRLAGTAYALSSVGAAAAVAHLLARAFPSGHRRFWTNVALVWCALGGKSLDRAAAQVEARLQSGDQEGAKRALRSLVGRDLDRLSTSLLSAAAIESLADNAVDAVLGAALWFALLGAGGCWTFRAANTLDAMVGHRSPRYRRFGTAAARLDDLMVVPAAAVGVAGCGLLAPLFGVSPAVPLRSAITEGRRHPSPGSGPIQAAFGAVLGVRLGGPRRYAGHLEALPTFGGSRPPTPQDIGRARLLARLLSLLGVAGCALLAERLQRGVA